MRQVTTGHEWTILNETGHEWTILNETGHEWTIFNETGHEWTILNETRHDRSRVTYGPSLMRQVTTGHEFPMDHP